MEQPLIWAHRGASGYAPENTLPSFQKAVEMKADGVELDIQLTKDDVIVVCHDEKVNRTSNGKGWIKDFTFEELRKLDFSNKKPEYAGVQIPTMEEVFDLLKDTGLTINIELKTGVVFYQDLEEKILRMAQEKGWEDRVIYSSFNHASMKKLKALNPNAKAGLLYADGTINMPTYTKELGMDAIHPALYNLQYEGVVEECKQLGLKINTWTVNEEEHLLFAKQFGVDAVITNYPDRARRLYYGE